MPGAEECMCCKHFDYTVGILGELECIKLMTTTNLPLLNPEWCSFRWFNILVMFKKQQERSPEGLSKQSEWFIYNYQ